MSGSAAQLYQEDFVRWTEQQSSALREAAGVGTNLPLDWENLAEESGSLGRSQRHEVRSRIAVISEHLLKLEHSPAVDPRRGWIDTIGRERLNIEDLLQDSPSLRNQVGPIIEQLKPRVARLATTSLFGSQPVWSQPVWSGRDSQKASGSRLHRRAGARRLVPAGSPSPR